MMNGMHLSLFSFKIRRVLEIPEIAWQRRESSSSDICATTQILGFLYEPLGG